MLRENLQDRPNIFQVLKEGCAMQGRDVPVQDVGIRFTQEEFIITMATDLQSFAIPRKNR